jgi:hypothetical protein
MLARLIVEHAASSPILVASQDVDWLRALGAFIFNLDTGKVGPPEHGLT